MVMTPSSRRRLSNARRQLADSHAPIELRLVDTATVAFWCPMLVPLLETAIAAVGAERRQEVGLLLFSGTHVGPESISRLADHVRNRVPDLPRVRFSETELAIIVFGMAPGAALTEARALLVLPEADGLGAFSGHASLAAGVGVADLILTAEATLAMARRAGPGTVFG